MYKLFVYLFQLNPRFREKLALGSCQTLSFQFYFVMLVMAVGFVAFQRVCDLSFGVVNNYPQNIKQNMYTFYKPKHITSFVYILMVF